MGNENQWISVASTEGVIRLLNRIDGAEVAVSEALGVKILQAVLIESGGKLVALQEGRKSASNDPECCGKETCAG